METNQSGSQISTWKIIIIEGLFFAVFMFVIMEFMSPYAKGEEFVSEDLFKSLLIWIAAGILMSGTSKLLIKFIDKKNNSK